MKEETIQLKEALYALGCMWNQYCGTRGHLFMNAGERASEVLMNAGLLKDEWSEIDYEVLEKLLLPPTPTESQ